MRIKIIQIGSTKERYTSEIVMEYLKRLRPFFKVEEITLKPVPVSKSFSMEKAILREGEQILQSIKNDDYVVALDEHGKSFSSIEFSKFIEKRRDFGTDLVFVIGGAFGLSKAVKSRSDLLFSISKMTFTHQMVRIFLMEQLYRAVSILEGKHYHNE